MPFLATTKRTIRDIIVKRDRTVNLFSISGFFCRDFIRLRVWRQFETFGSAPESTIKRRPGVFARKIDVVQ